MRHPPPLNAAELRYLLRGVLVAVGVVAVLASLRGGDPGPAALAAAGRPEEALAAYLAAADAWGTDARRAEALVAAATLAEVELGRPQEAIRLLRDRLQRFPQAPGRDATLDRLGHLYAEALDDPARGAATLDEAAQAAPAAAGPRLLRAAAWWEQAGQLDKARADAVLAEATAPLPAALLLGRLLLDPDPAGAADAFGRALALAPDDDTAALARLGQATALERLEGAEAALAALDEAPEGADPALDRRRNRLLRHRQLP